MQRPDEESERRASHPEHRPVRRQHGNRSKTGKRHETSPHHRNRPEPVIGKSATGRADAGGDVEKDAEDKHHRLGQPEHRRRIDAAKGKQGDESVGEQHPRQKEARHVRDPDGETHALPQACKEGGCVGLRRWLAHKQEQRQRENDEPQRGETHGDSDMRRVGLADAKRRFRRQHEQKQHQAEGDDRADIAKSPGKTRCAAIFRLRGNRGKHRVVEDEADLHCENRRRRQRQRRQRIMRVRKHEPKPRRRHRADDGDDSEAGLQPSVPVGKPSQKRGRDGNCEGGCRGHPGPGGGAAVRHHGGGEID